MRVLLIVDYFPKKKTREIGEIIFFGKKFLNFETRNCKGDAKGNG